VLIPAYNPDEKLISIVEELTTRGFYIVIVNDGSHENAQPIFNRVGQIPNTNILQHQKNRGKGAALKTGFAYISSLDKKIIGVVTADADGQHTSIDIQKIATALEKNPKKLILGSRSFKGNVPFRSFLGNFITKYVFSLLVGIKISDTQTGLRGIPAQLLPLLQQLDGNRYEYEMNVLLAAKTNHIEIQEESICTVYIDNNKSSQFSPVLDSMKIYFLIFRFAFSSLLASIIDFMIFSFTYKLIIPSILISIILARIAASIINYLTNKNLVFHDKSSYLKTIIKYYLLTIIMMSLSYLLINLLSTKAGLNVIFAKIIAESFLFIINFWIQRDLIFIKTKPSDAYSNDISNSGAQ